jgi:hypothetical protein
MARGYYYVPRLRTVRANSVNGGRQLGGGWCINSRVPIGHGRALAEMARAVVIRTTQRERTAPPGLEQDDDRWMIASGGARAHRVRPRETGGARGSSREG